MTLNTSAITQGKSGFKAIEKVPEPMRLTDSVQFKRLHLTIVEAESLPVGHSYEIEPEGLKGSKCFRRDGRTYAGYDETTNDILLPSNEFGIGSTHFVIEFNSVTNQYLIKDEGDGTGTFVKLTRPLPLQSYYILSFGSTHMTVILSQQDDQSRLTVKFIEGPKAGQSYLFGPSDKTIKIGRMQDCSIKFDDNSLSRYQCTIRFTDDLGWTVSDGDGVKGSTNGTWLFLDDYFQIESGMVFKAGMTLFQVRGRQASLEIAEDSGQVAEV